MIIAILILERHIRYQWIQVCACPPSLEIQTERGAFPSNSAMGCKAGFSISKELLGRELPAWGIPLDLFPD